MGYQYPPQTSSVCVNKYITVSVFPKDPAFVQGTDKLTLTASAEDAKVVDLTQEDLSNADSTRSAYENQQKVYRQFFQDQENAEFLGAVKLAASASVATLAAFTLF